MSDIAQFGATYDDLRAANAKLRAEADAARNLEAERQAAIDAELERLRGIARASGRRV